MNPAGTTKLPLRTTLVYGLGGMGMNLCDMIFLQWLYQRYAPSKANALVPAFALGAIILASRVAECFYNIAVGHWSDNFRSRWGRRIPFMRAGLLPLALAFFLMYTPPAGFSTPFYGVYVFILLQLYLCFYGAVITPYLSLLPEITSDLHERVNLTTAQSVFILLASVIFAVMGTILDAGGWTAVAAVVAVVTVFSLGPAALTLREDPSDHATREKTPLRAAMKSALKNPAFFYIALSTSFYWFGLNMIIAMVPFWVKDYLGRDESAVTYVMLPFLAMNVVGFVLFNLLTKRFGKYPMFLVTLAGSAVAFACFGLVGRVPLGSPFLQTILVTGLAGIPVAGFMVIPFALLADAVDHDEHRTGHRREAIFFSLQGVFQKFLLGISALTFGTLITHGAETSVTRNGLDLVVAAALAGAVAAFFVFLHYPLRERDGKVCLAERHDPAH